MDKLKAALRKAKEEEVHYETEIKHLKEEVQKREFELKNKPERDTGAGSTATSNLFHVSNNTNNKWFPNNI